MAYEELFFIREGALSSGKPITRLFGTIGAGNVELIYSASGPDGATNVNRVRARILRALAWHDQQKETTT